MSGRCTHLLGPDRGGEAALGMRAKAFLSSALRQMGPARCKPLPARVAPSSTKFIEPNSAPQTRVAFSSIFSNTGGRSLGDELII